jgi:hypothetical protein
MMPWYWKMGITLTLLIGSLIALPFVIYDGPCQEGRVSGAMHQGRWRA